MIETETPFQVELPSPFKEQLDEFQRLLVTKQVRNEKLLSGLRLYIQS